MNIKEETGHDFSALNEVKLSAEDKNEILKNLREEMASYRPKRRRYMSGVVPGIAAAVAAVAIVAGGVGFEMHRNQPVQIGPKGLSTASNQTEANSNSVPNNIVHPNDNAQLQPVQTVTLSNGITVQTYSTSQAAAATVSQLQASIGQVYPSGPPVDLGTGIKANFNGGAGTYVYQWKEGNWTINLRGVGNSTPGTQTAKNVVSYLHTHMLPAPKNEGTIIIASPSGASAGGSTWNTTMAWQEGNKVYQLKQSGNPVNALAVAVAQNSSGNPGNAQSQPPFQQTFKHAGASNQVFLTPDIGFEETNLGGGASNFMYQFSKTTDGGKTWTKLSTGHYNDVSGVSFINTKTGFLLNTSPAYAITPDLFVTHDGGVTWREQKLPIPSAYTNYYRQSSFPIFFSPTIGFIPVTGASMSGTGTQHFLYMLVTTDGGSSWTPFTQGQGAGLSWKMSGQQLTITEGTKTLTVNNLLAGNWSVSTGG